MAGHALDLNRKFQGKSKKPCHHLTLTFSTSRLAAEAGTRIAMAADQVFAVIL
jgi:hypothetical protein